MEELENIDDECDALGITFVKIDNADEAKEYGIDRVPKLLYFEKGIPTVYEGKLENEEDLLKWLEQQTTSDEIEDITDEMLDLIIEKMPYVAVLFCKIYILINNLMIEILIFFFHLFEFVWRMYVEFAICSLPHYQLPQSFRLLIPYLFFFVSLVSRFPVVCYIYIYLQMFFLLCFILSPFI